MSVDGIMVSDIDRHDVFGLDEKFEGYAVGEGDRGRI